MNEWINAKDRLPEPAVPVIVATNTGDVWFAWVSCLESDPMPTWHTSDEIEGNVTHWMPLPEAPK